MDSANYIFHIYIILRVLNISVDLLMENAQKLQLLLILLYIIIFV